MPATKTKLQRRRTEDEMRSSLSSLVTGKTPQRDDEWEQILSDAISECIEWRRIGMYVLQGMGELRAKVDASIKTMGQ